MKVEGGSRWSTIEVAGDSGINGQLNQFTFTGTQTTSIRWEVNIRVRECEYLYYNTQHAPLDMLIILHFKLCVRVSYQLHS